MQAAKKRGLNDRRISKIEYHAPIPSQFNITRHMLQSLIREPMPHVEVFFLTAIISVGLLLL